MTALAAVARQGGDPKGLRAQHDRAAAGTAATPNLSSDKPHKSCGQGAAINLSDSGPQQEQAMTDVEAIVGKLTNLEAELLCGTAKGWGSWMWAVGHDLIAKGLMAKETDVKIVTTPLGESVRTYLLKDETR